MTIFEKLNPSIQAQVVASIDGLIIKEKMTNMFGVEASMEKIHEHWLLGIISISKVKYTFIYVYFHLHV
jgi:hypothetical protein